MMSKEHREAVRTLLSREVHAEGTRQKLREHEEHAGVLRAKAREAEDALREAQSQARTVRLFGQMH